MNSQDFITMTEKNEEEEEDKNILSIKDHLSNSETISFWKRYFPHQDLGVSNELFFEAIKQEF